ncbi:MAG: phosphoribosylformylglycinamidine cyclo-ligase [Propionibacteriaceae bacterium]
MSHDSAYAQAGVDIVAADKSVELIKQWVGKTKRTEVLGGLGGFAGLFDASALKNYRHPVLATSTDGVGTKVAIAQAMDIHDTIGFDLVGMVVDDLVVVGAEPLFMTDYICCGALNPQRIEAIVKGISLACVEAGCALVGGETAEHPGLLHDDEYDIAGATTGVVELDAMLGPDRVRPGDVVLAIAASGLHSNGYSLVRHIVAGQGWSYDRQMAEFGRTLGEELLVPTRIYAKACLALARELELHAMCHVTGGGLANNLMRVLPSNVAVTIERSTWQPAPVFTVLQEAGKVSHPDIEATLNMGVGMVVILPETEIAKAQYLLAGYDMESWMCGHVMPAQGAQGGVVTLVGSHCG